MSLCPRAARVRLHPMRSGSTAAERRCPDCGALASPDAEWCGQCFRSLTEPEVEEPARAEPSPALAAPAATDARAATWPCPACGNENALDLDACSVCGTTFASLMRQDEAPPRVDPKDAASASLLYPGLGHRKVGRGLDGLARGVLFTVLAAMAATVLISGVDSAGTLGVLLLFVGGALLVYLGSAYEAYRMAAGEGPLVSSRALLWATVAIVIGSVMVIAVSLISAAR